MAKKNENVEHLVIERPNIETSVFKIKGTAPYVQHKFSSKARKQMLEKQMSAKATQTKKELRDPEADYQGAMHMTTGGKHGIPAPAFRAALISACRVAGFTMTKAKLSVFIVADDVDIDDGTPLVLIKGNQEMNESYVRLPNGTATISFRPMWREWTVDLKIRYDADQFTQSDVLNLLHRAGMQVGIGEGRPDSKKSNGMGWGTFEVYS